MRMLFRTFQILLACCLLSALALDASGQSESPQDQKLVAGSSKPPRSRPTKRSLRQAPEPVDPQLEAILLKWIEANAGIERLDAEFDYVQTDTVLETSKQATGLISVDIYGRWMFALHDLRTPSLTKKQDPFSKADEPQIDSKRYHCNGSEWIYIDEQAHVYSRTVFGQLEAVTYLPTRPLPPPLPEDVSPTKERLPDQGAEFPVTKKSLKAKSESEPAEIPANEDEEPQQNSSWVGTAVGAVILTAILVGISSSAPSDAMKDWRVVMDHPACQFLLPNSLTLLKSHYRISLKKQTHTEVQLEFTSKHDWLPQRKAYLQLSLPDYRPTALKLEGEPGSLNSSLLGVGKVLRINAPPEGRFPDLGAPDLSQYQPVEDLIE